MTEFVVPVAERESSNELEALRRANALLGRLVAVQQEVALAGLDEAGVQRVVALRARELTGADVALVDALDGDALVCRAASPAGAERVGRGYPTGRTLAGRALRTDETLRVGDVAADGRVALAELEGLPDARSLVVTPVGDGERAAGVLRVASSRPDAFSETDLQLLGLLANMLSAAYEGVRRLREKRALIAELECANGALRESETRYRLIFEGTDQGLFLVGRGPDGGYEYAAMNDALSAMMGIPVDRFVGSTPADVLPPEGAERVTGLYDRVFRTGSMQEVLHTNRLPRGEVTTRTRLHPVRDGRGEVMGVLGISEDVTERERLRRLKSAFVSTVSHELRTPLTSIRGSLGLVAGGAGGELTERGQQLVDVGLRNAERLIRLVNDLLDMDRIESGQLEVSVGSHPLDELVRTAAVESDGYALEHRVRIQVEAMPAATVRADPDRFHQVMSNLLSNAIKFSPEGEVVDVRADVGEDRVRIVVRDRGDGIPEAFRARVFDRFARADATDRRRTGGTGLGLSITRALVERMGGRIWFDTSAGEGTTFTVEIPRG